MCVKCRASTALAKAMAKEALHPDDPRSADDIWWVGQFDGAERLISHEQAQDFGRRAYEVELSLEAQGFKIVEA